MLNEPWDAINLAAFNATRAGSTSPHWLTSASAILTEAPLFLMFVVSIGWIAFRRDKGAAISLALAVGVALAIEWLISTFAYHARPFEAGCVVSLVPHRADNSMPSTHVTLALIMTFEAFVRRHWLVGTVGLGASVCMAWARIYTGIHWPADMIGAALSCCISVGISSFAIRTIRRSGICAT